jgi:tRNA nucleotidyltransferase (CCA-adding enzyme)
MQKMLKPHQKNQIRLLKAFLKGIGIYGAELSTSGFSGYVTEVLVLKFGNFKNVIKFIASLTRDNEIITIDNDFHEINNIKLKSPLVIIDPIDSNRNLGKAISPESLSRFIYASRAFLLNPSINFFKTERENEAKNIVDTFAAIDNLLPNILVLEFSFRSRSPDIIWGQLKKLTKSITRLFNENEFITIKSGCYLYGKNSAKLTFLLKYTIISPFFEKKGPSIFMENEVFQFVNKNKNKKNSTILWITEEMKVVCLNNRKVIDAIKFLELALKNEKSSSIGIPRGLINDFDKGFKIYTLNKNSSKYKDNQKIVLDFLYKDMILFGSRY